MIIFLKKSIISEYFFLNFILEKNAQEIEVKFKKKKKIFSKIEKKDHGINSAKKTEKLGEEKKEFVLKRKNTIIEKKYKKMSDK